jgi:hypothetical protein
VRRHRPALLALARQRHPRGGEERIFATLHEAIAAAHSGALVKASTPQGAPAKDQRDGGVER